MAKGFESGTTPTAAFAIGLPSSSSKRARNNAASNGSQVPPLVAGDRLTRAEFERRYEAMPHVKKAELIEGVVYMGSPVSQDSHGSQHFQANTWLGLYVAGTPGTDGGNNSTVRLDLDNEPQPDLFIRILPNYGGQSRDDEDYVGGAPELVMEISGSTKSYDLHDKLNAYRRNGVREYVVWRTWDAAIDWFVLREGRYEALPSSEGILKSETFPGLWLDAAAMLAGNLPRVLEVLQQGLATAEHAQFVKMLANIRQE